MIYDLRFTIWDLGEVLKESSLAKALEANMLKGLS